MSKTVEDIGTLKINLLSQAQYDAEKAGGRLADDELYLTPSSGTGVSDVEVNGDSVVSGGVAEITINDIPSGGTTGQVLTKDSGTDYDVSWEDPSGGTITDVTVDGTSIVDDGVAELETVTQLRGGLMTALDKQKLDGIASGAEVNVQSDWNQSTNTADDYIKNKPTIPTITDTYSGTSSNGMSGKAVKSAIDALDGTISGSAGAGKTLTALSQTDGKVSATFGNISITKSQVSDFPTIPTVNNATLTIQKNGTTVNTFTANASSNVTANISVPTQASDIGAQPTLVSGTNIKTINSESLLGSGNITLSAEDEIFYCDFETTTLAEAVTEYNAGKTLICRYTDIADVVVYAPLIDVTFLNGSAEGFAFSVGGYGSFLGFLLSPNGWTFSEMSATSTPTNNKLPLFDTTAHMNSTDMTSSEVEDFVDELDISGGGEVVVAEEQSKLESATAGTITLHNCTGTVSHNQIYFAKLASGLWFITGRLNINSFTRSGSNPGVNIALPSDVPTPTQTRNFICGFRSQNTREGVMLGLTANSRNVTLTTHESFSNAADGTLTFIVNSIFALD